MKNQTKYPKFISSHPCGKDMTFGKSQERVARTIKEHIQNEEIKTKNKKNGEEENCLSHIIGLEGSWGIGKSNLIRILKNDYLKDTHYIFEYDAWGHQEDLQRRSFLETLTDELVKEKILTGETTVELKNGDIKSVSWKDKLKYLLARKFETETEQYPKIGYGIIMAFFTAIFLPITNYIANVSGSKAYWKILIIAAPAIISFAITFIIWVVKSVKNKKMASLDFLLATYQGKVVRNIEFKTISENEPSVTAFKNWMNDVSKALVKESQPNLIIVFDNMDRLPAFKVKALWSSIHTFFAEVSYDNIWVIITFDKNHLANAFGKSEGFENEEEAKELASHFIKKTFPVIYRVASPVISDLKLVFSDYFDEAFGKDDIASNEKNTILRIFEIINPNPTIRDIIAFINELVSQKMAWNEEISLFHIAVFTLTKDKIIKDKGSIAENILSNNYYKDIHKIIDDEQELQESIAALAYNIDKDSARQIPIKQYLKNLFNEENSTKDINSHSSHRCFMEVLLDVIQGVDITLTGWAIKRMGGLNTAKLKDSENRLKEIWNYLTSQKIKQKIDSLKLKEEHRILLLRGSEENRKSIFKYLRTNFQNFKKINGAEYYDAISQLRDYVADKKLNLDIQTQLEETPVAPEVFINYVEKAKDEYTTFKLICDNSELNQYLVGLLPDNMKHTSFFDYLSSSSYDFMEFCNKLKGHIPTLTNDNFYWLNYAYKALFPSKPLDALLDQNQIATLQTTITDKTIDGYFDISAMALGNNLNVTVDVNDGETIKEIAKRIEYYHDYGTLLISSVSRDDPGLNKVLAELTTNSQGESMANICEILPHFEQILSSLNIESSVLLKRLDGWSKFAEEELNKDNVEQIVEYTFYSHSIQSNNDLTKHIHKVAKERLSEIDSDVLLQQRNEPTSYWLVTAKTLIDGKVLKALTDKLVEFVKKTFIDISDTATMPNEIVSTIINKMPSNKITPTIKDIAAKYYTGEKAINTQMFRFFEPYFREKDRINGREGDFTRTILNTVVTDNECRALILQHDEFYADIVKIAGDDAEDFKTKIKELCQSQPSEALNKFATLTGVKIINTGSAFENRK